MIVIVWFIKIEVLVVVALSIPIFLFKPLFICVRPKHSPH